ncbi:MAG: DUF488 domain-containing protein [bacterium]
MPITTKRIYASPEAQDGFRVLVDRLWPRGLSKEKAKVDLWLKEIAPSDALRKWYGHDPENWQEFKKRYFEELQTKKDMCDMIRQHARKGAVTLLYAKKDEKRNNALALQEYLKIKR